MRKPRNRARENEQRRERKRNNYEVHWAVTTIYNRGMIVEFTKDWLEQRAHETKYCELCEVELRWKPCEQHAMFPDTPTLDRISNERVLTKDNTMILCNSCNAGKGIMNLDEYIAKCKRITNTNWR